MAAVSSSHLSEALQAEVVPLPTLSMFLSSHTITSLHANFGTNTETDLSPRMIDVPLWIAELLYDVLNQHIDKELANTISDAEQVSEVAEEADLLSSRETSDECTQTSHIPEVDFPPFSDEATDHNEQQYCQQMADLFVQASGEKTYYKHVKQPLDPSPKDEQLAILNTLTELFPQFSPKMVKKVLQEKNYDFDLVYDELAAGSTVGEFKDDTRHLASTVVTNSLARKATRPASPANSYVTDSSSSSGISSASDSNPTSLFQKAEYYRDLAARCPNKTIPIFGQYLRMASECATLAKDMQYTEDEDVASKVCDILDLHGYEVTRAVRILDHSIQNLKREKPKQKYLEVITGIGNRNAKNKAPLRDAVRLWLEQKKIVYEQQRWNQGSFKVDLKSF